jgi:hypothetical protein
MAKLMQRGAVEIDLFVEALLRRQLDAIRRRHVERLVATDADLRARGRHQAFRARDRLTLAEERATADRQRIRQPLALIDIEDGEALEERHLPAMLVARLGDRRVLLGLGREAISVADRRASLALADIAAKRLVG